MTQPPEPTFKQTLTVTRAIWAVFMAGQIAFLFVIIALSSTSNPPSTSPENIRLLFYISIGAALVMIPAGYMARSQAYKSSWRGSAILPRGYLRGNLLLFAFCEAVAMLGLVATLLNGKFMPTIIPTAIALAVQAVNFPHGKPMHPAQNPYQQAGTREP